MKPTRRQRFSRALTSAAAVGAAVALTWCAGPGQALSGAAPLAERAVGANGSRTTVTLKLWERDGGEFWSPAGVSCELDNGYAGLHQVYCQTVKPPESVTLQLNGKLHVCKGMLCLGNPADNSEELHYGATAASGPFQCLSTKAGITCTVGHKGGFSISTKGVRKVKP